MRIATQLTLVIGITLASSLPAAASLWNCRVPEIDGPAGVSAIALLVSAGMIAYQRYRQ